MSSESEERRCALCRQPAGVGYAAPAKYRIDCKRCGTYEITKMLQLMYKSTSIPDAHLLSGYTREQSETNPQEVVLLTEKDIEAIASAAPHKAAAKADKLIRAIRRRTDFFGKKVVLDAEADYPLAYAEGAAEFTAILRHLQGQSRLEQHSRTPTGVEYTLSLADFDSAAARESVLSTGEAPQSTFTPRAEAMGMREEDPEIIRGQILATALAAHEKTGQYVEADEIARQLGLTVDEVEGHLGILRDRETLELVETLSEPPSVHFTPAQRQAAREHLASRKQNAEGVDLPRVFVVHGHDEGARESVARFLERLQFEPVILHEQPNKGRTIIEKFEDYADVQFAVVLLTGDDQGCSVTEYPGGARLRARQNVIFELGYFLSALGRDKVCALHKEGVEILSDYQGVVFVEFDAHGGWKFKLAQEIKAAGLPVDMNRVQ